MLRKKYLLGLTSALCLMSLQSFAYSYYKDSSYSFYRTGPFFGIQAGAADMDHEFKNDISTSIDAGAARLYGGYDFNRNIGLELGYTYFEGQDVRVTYRSATQILHTDVDFKQDVFDVMGKLNFPITCALAIYGKGGLAWIHRDVEVPVDGTVVVSGETDDKLRPTFAAGLNYAFSSKIGADAFVSTIIGSDHVQTTFYGIGLNFKLA